MAKAENPGTAQTESSDQPENRARPRNVSVEELRQYLTDVEGKTATQRIMVGINHKEGVPQTELADWYDVSRTTIHNWLNRLERLDEEPLEEVIYDEERPGRPSKLNASQKRQLEEVLNKPPAAAGYDTSEWTPLLTRTYIEETFGVEYTLSHVRELMHEAGVSWNKTRSKEQSEQRVQEAFKSGFEQSEQSQHRMHGCRR